MDYLTSEEKQELKDMEYMFGTDGWKTFIKRQKEALEGLPERSLYAQNEQELFFIKGQHHIIKQLVEYEEFYYNVADKLNTERQIEQDQLGSDARMDLAANA